MTMRKREGSDTGGKFMWLLLGLYIHLMRGSPCGSEILVCDHHFPWSNSEDSSASEDLASSDSSEEEERSKKRKKEKKKKGKKEKHKEKKSRKRRKDDRVCTTNVEMRINLWTNWYTYSYLLR